jgi:glycosyltransferase involved in cell wall biosynthesis
MNSFINDESAAAPLTRADVCASVRSGPVLLVDPSLFTAPYDEALVAALRALGVDATLVGRRCRIGETEAEVPFRASFYRRFDGAPRRFGAAGAVLKGLEHVAGGSALARSVRRERACAHFQWLPLPIADAVMLRLVRRGGPVVVTVHDTRPFNGAPTARLQVKGFVTALRLADRLIVHTASGKDRLTALGLDRNRIRVVPHGPLGVHRSRRSAPGARYTLVAFGKMRPYKGLDLLVAAVAACPVATREALRIVVAGEPMIDLGPLRRAIAAADLSGTLEIEARRFSEAEMEALFDQADAFVFPYREIEASGVFYRVQGLGRWLVASRLGAFAEAIEDGVSGRLVAAGDVAALTGALVECARRRPSPTGVPAVTGWPAIAAATCEVYGEAWASWAASTKRGEVWR